MGGKEQGTVPILVKVATFSSAPSHRTCWIDSIALLVPVVGHGESIRGGAATCSRALKMENSPEALVSDEVASDCVWRDRDGLKDLY